MTLQSPTQAGLATRRNFLARSGMGFALLGLNSVLADSGHRDRVQVDPLVPLGSHFAPRARHIIHIFLNGGLSHVDSFDPKPLLARHDGKPLPTPNLITERLTGAAFAPRTATWRVSSRGARAVIR